MWSGASGTPPPTEGYKERETGGRPQGSPLHHHFEMCGWKETKIVAVFTTVSVVFCVLAYLGVMNRFAY